MSKISILFVLLYIIQFFYRCSASHSPGDIPNPNKNPDLCGRGTVKSSAICDPDNMLSRDSKDVIEGFMNQITKAQVGVLIIDKMSPIYVGFSSIERSTETFARTVHDSWGLGDKSTNNGILIFLSVKDRSVYISTGKGVMKDFTTSIIDLIIEHMTPSLKKGEYDKAFEKAVVEVKLILDGKKIPDYYSSTTADSDSAGFVGVVGLFAVVIGIGTYFNHLNNQKRNALKKGQATLDKLMKEMSDCKENNTFSSPTCPICLEDFPADIDKKDEHHNHPEPSTADQEAQESSAPLNPPAEKKLNPHRPMSLQCGHVFCFDCLSTHLKSQNGAICPICRASVNPDDPSRPSSRQTYHRPPHDPNSSSDTDCSANRTNAGGDTFSANDLRSRSTASYTSPAWNMRSTEFVYRLTRMQRLYPTVMTNEVHASMSSAIDTGNIETLRLLATRRVAEVDRIITDMDTRAAARSSGSSGSRSSFGGGHSSGGRGGRF